MSVICNIQGRSGCLKGTKRRTAGSRPFLFPPRAEGPLCGQVFRTPAIDEPSTRSGGGVVTAPRTKSSENGAPSVPRRLWGISRGLQFGEVGQSGPPQSLCPRRLSVVMGRTMATHGHFLQAGARSSRRSGLMPRPNRMPVLLCSMITLIASDTPQIAVPRREGDSTREEILKRIPLHTGPTPRGGAPCAARAICRSRSGRIASQPLDGARLPSLHVVAAGAAGPVPPLTGRRFS